jgi:hypothetical protein
MTPKICTFIIIVFFSPFFIASCSSTQRISLWDRHCESCHDGKTMLNGKVVPDKEQMKVRYKTLDDFVHACAGAPLCMNIVKHEEKLLIETGTEIGLK